MCDPSLLMAGGLAESLGDPLGTRRRREDSEKNRWAREDAVRDAQFAHDKELAGIKYGSNTNRSSLNAGQTGTPTSTHGGGRSTPGGSKTDKAY